MKSRWTEVELDKLKCNYNKMSRKNLVKLFKNRTEASLSQKAGVLGLTNYENNHSWHTKISYNKNFFKHINTDSSYWAGFIAADGNIDIINNKIRIKLAGKDKIHLISFAKAIKFTGKIREYIRDTNKGKNYSTCYIDLCGAKNMIEDLKSNFNITNNKSLSLKAPYKLINTLDILSYIKGMIDGDGWVSNKKDRFELLCTKSVADYIISFFKDLQYIINIKNKKETEGLFVVYKTNKEIVNLIKSSSVFGLERKWSGCPTK